jgi:hypothetical protein
VVVVEGIDIDELKKSMSPFGWKLFKALQHFNSRARNGAEIRVVWNDREIVVSAYNSYLSLEFEGGYVKLLFRRLWNFENGGGELRIVRTGMEMDMDMFQKVSTSIVGLVDAMPVSLNALVETVKDNIKEVKNEGDKT